MNTFYILDSEHRPVQATMEEWGRLLESGRRRVARTEINERVMVSTVFLGIDHRLGGDGPPLLFETMIFDGDSGGECWRYASWDDAEAGHAAVVKRLRKVAEDWR